MLFRTQRRWDPQVLHETALKLCSIQHTDTDRNDRGYGSDDGLTTQYAAVCHSNRQTVMEKAEANREREILHQRVNKEVTWVPLF